MKQNNSWGKKKKKKAIILEHSYKKGQTSEKMLPLFRTFYITRSIFYEKIGGIQSAMRREIPAESVVIVPLNTHTAASFFFSL